MGRTKRLWGGRRREVWEFILKFTADNKGITPTRREIGSGVGIPSTSTVSYHLEVLEYHGLIYIQRWAARGIVVPDSKWEYTGKYPLPETEDIFKTAADAITKHIRYVPEGDKDGEY